MILGLGLPCVIGKAIIKTVGEYKNTKHQKLTIKNGK
jgi:hypothetical protein